MIPSEVSCPFASAIEAVARLPGFANVRLRMW